ncbi:hypothetical protein [Streptomyces sp. DSM 41634]|uniref:hypothetical protein n=1 Tax=Streptomyces sp. DSM 41634 TaxID=3448656 RepID=UPI00403FE3BB
MKWWSRAKVCSTTAPTARKYMRGHSPKRGIPVPTGKLEGHATRYTEGELTTWLAAWQRQAGPTPGRPANEAE